MHRPAHNGLVYIDITVTDLDVVATIGVSANPGLIIDRCPLTAKVRKGDEIARLAPLAFGESSVFHRSTSQPLINFEVYIKLRGLAMDRKQFDCKWRPMVLRCSS